MAHWLNLGQILKVNAKKFPETIALKDATRSLTYPELNRRVNQLANSLLALGLKKGDKVAVLLENCIEIVEVYLATAKTGIVMVPVNFRLIGKEIAYIVENSDAQAFIVHEEFAPTVDSIKLDLKNIEPDMYIVVGVKADGYREYEEFIRKSPDDEIEATVNPEDTWVILYTSGTTGVPKGVVRSHESYIAFYLISAVDFGFCESDICLNVMPLFHVNSTFFTFIFLYIGGSVYVHPARSFDALEILETIERERVTFISLIPTHYHLILTAGEEAKKFDTGTIRKLLCSSAPATRKMKIDIMEFFPGVQLYEGYGSTEAGIVTVLKPEDQMRKLGSIGFESAGTDFVKILDTEGKEVEDGVVGELYSRSPMLFDEYYKLPEKTAASFVGEWFSAGDMARRDGDGFYYLVDRKDNMIITGGEHVYPSELEEIIGCHPDVVGVAVIGLPDDKWGEKVAAVVVAKCEMEEKVIIDHCRDKVAGYKRPKQIMFISAEDMPRTASGKIIHRKLKECYCSGKED
jgi:acyl-CoA synthetase (AMP-forming)/AMP-acid ligase II